MSGNGSARDTDLPVSPAAQALAGAAGAGGGQKSYDSAAKLVKSPEVFLKELARKRFHNGPTGALASECLWLHSSNLCGGVEEKAESGPANPAMCTPGEKERSIKLYVILGSYLRNRPLGLLKSEGSQDGYTVWRKLFQELEPSNRTRLRPW